MQKFLFYFIASMLLFSRLGFAQHDSSMHNMKPAMDKNMKMEDSSSMDKNMKMQDSSKMDMKMDMKMTSAFSNHLPMSRDGSGTSWHPDSSPMMAYMKMKNKTMLMFHYAVFVRYTKQDVADKSNRGDKKFDAPNWLMFMLTQKLGEHDLFSFHSMISLDGVTEGKRGYPLLFQTGESADGKPLVDRQHPHDLFSALALNYTHSFSKDVDANAYFGYPGEPALGPPVFMHRPSAMNNPDAALGHHWMDATHITFGVGTIGIRYKNVKAEGSIFTGREPDEKRFDFDKPKFDSYSARVSVNPTENLALQVSRGFIKSPEVLEPDTDVTRTTASLLHNMKLTNESNIATSVVWGWNHNSYGENLQSFLIESNLMLMPLSIYARFEWIQKDAHELELESFDNNPTFNINAFTLGINKTLFTSFKTDFSLGVQGTINFPDEKIKPFYGNSPVGVEIFLKIAPAMMKKKSM
ncbi:MAG TPA: hypothetical protein VJY62_20250 [Bacteroidia bacterium]|nr:hypothetical protein [Bacteroidia bacterium]